MNGHEETRSKKADKARENVLNNVKTDLITESRLRSKNFNEQKN